MNNYISIQNVSFSYQKKFCLQIAELNINKHEKVAFIGPSGCGKTTLISLIAGIYKPQQGNIWIDKQQISSLSNHNRRKYRLGNIGFIFQNFELLEYLSVKDNILLPFILQSQKTTKEVQQKLETLLQQMHIEDKENRYPHELSQGEKQRVAIARALIHKPQIIIADEPTGNLDPKNSKNIIDLLWQELENKITLIMVTHDHRLLEKFDRVFEIGDSNIKEVK